MPGVPRSCTRASPRWPVTAFQGAAYLLLAAFAYRQVLASPTSRMPICACGDQAQEVWFLRWPLYALEHGLNPFLTTFMNFPAGANLTINTAAPLLGWVSAPLQLAVGSVATYDLLLVLAMAGSAFSMSMALRRYVPSRLAGFVGGLVYGFSHRSRSARARATSSSWPSSSRRSCSWSSTTWSSASSTRRGATASRSARCSPPSTSSPPRCWP